MSEPSLQELVEELEYEIAEAAVIPVPIDPTLSNEGEAADAKAVGDAIAAIATVKKVNDQSPDSSGNVTVLATQINMSDDEGAQTVAEAIFSTQTQTAETILYQTGETPTIKETVDEVITACTEGCTDDEIDEIFEDWEG